jgi:integrase
VLMPALAEALRQHMKESRFQQPDDFVFTTRAGTPLHWTNLATRALKPALRSAGLRPMRWHDLRHTFASLLIAGSWATAQARSRLGSTRTSSTVKSKLSGHGTCWSRCSATSSDDN